MRLTTKGRYAVTAMLDLALHADEGPVSLADISERQGISISYLEQLFAKLRRRHLVSSVRGPGGGYCLMPEARTVSIAAIMAAVEPDCDGTGGRPPGGGPGAGNDCPVCRLWDAFHSHALRYLQQVSLADVVAGRIPEGILAPRERTAPAGPAGPAAAAAGATAQAADGAV